MKLSDEASAGWIWKAVGCGTLVVASLYGLGILLGGAFRPLQKIAQSQTCQSNLIRLTHASMMYIEDYDRRVQPAAGWMDRIIPYVPAERYFHCPVVSLPGETLFGYGMNVALDNLPLDKVDDRSVTSFLFDSSNPMRSATGNPDELLPNPGRHITRPRKSEPSKAGNFIGYADGNVRIKLDSAR